jgi:hypothetical protein
MISLSLVLQLFGPLYLGSAMASSSFQNLSAQSPRMPFLFSSSARAASGTSRQCYIQNCNSTNAAFVSAAVLLKQAVSAPTNFPVLVFQLLFLEPTF